MEQTFNVGVGMVAVLSADAVAPTLALLESRSVPAWPIGTVVAGTGEVVMTGNYAGNPSWGAL